MADTWNWAEDGGSAADFRGGLYLLPESGSAKHWQSNGATSYYGNPGSNGAGYGGSASGVYSSGAADAGYSGGSGSGGYPGVTTYGGYSGTASYGGYASGSGYGDSASGAYVGSAADAGYAGGSGSYPDGSTFGGYSRRSDYGGNSSGSVYSPDGSPPGARQYQAYGGASGTSGPTRTGVYPLGNAGQEQQYGAWGASGTQAPSWYSGGDGRQSSTNPGQYHFRDDPQFSKPRETAALPKFRPFNSQPGSAFGSSPGWPGVDGGLATPAPVFRPLDQDDQGGVTGSNGGSDTSQGSYPGPALGYPGALGYRWPRPPYSGIGWGNPAQGWGNGGAWPGTFGWGLLPAW